jgi:hypothetical protein
MFMISSLGYLTLFPQMPIVLDWFGFGIASSVKLD